jgi:integrase
MAAKVVWYREAWWVRTRWTAGAKANKKDRRVGTTKADKRLAEEIAKKINAALALGTFQPDSEREKPLPCDVELRRWHTTYAPTFKPSFEAESDRTIRNHLVPFFGSRDLREIREEDLLRFIGAKLDDGLAPRTIETHLSVLRRVLSLAYLEGHLPRNPASRLGELMRRVEKSAATEAGVVDSWNRDEIETLLRVAREHELRRGELLGLQWSDVDFDRYRIHVRRAWVKGAMTSPKSGRGRYIAMAPGVGSLLLDLLATRRREALSRGWPDVPEFVFPGETGKPLDENNIERTWRWLRRRAQKKGVRPLELHCTRHTWASFALSSGKSVRWVADQLGHASPMLTLKTYAHAIREEEADLSFADFEVREGSERL